MIQPVFRGSGRVAYSDTIHLTGTGLRSSGPQSSGLCRLAAWRQKREDSRSDDQIVFGTGCPCQRRNQCQLLFAHNCTTRRCSCGPQKPMELNYEYEA
jgi:hypothetical protein